MSFFLPYSNRIYTFYYKEVSPHPRAWILKAFSILSRISRVLKRATRGDVGPPEGSVHPLHLECVLATSSDSSSLFQVLPWWTHERAGLQHAQRRTTERRSVLPQNAPR